MRALALALFLLPGVALGAVAVDQTDFTGGYGSGAKTVTVDTAGADRLLVLIHNNIYDECTGNSVTSSGLTWTRIVHQVVSSKCTDIWVAWAAAQLTAHDISVNVGTNAEYALDVISFSGARDMTSLVAGTDYRTCTASGSAAPASTPACTATTITAGAMLAGGVMQWAGTQIAVGAGTELVHAAVGDGVHYAVRSTATVAQGSQTLTMAGNAPDSWTMAWAEVSAPQASPSPSPSPSPVATVGWYWGQGGFGVSGGSAAQQAVAAPVFAPAAGTYAYQPVSVSISTETAGAEIRYTTNGDTPTGASTLYSAPFNVTQTTTAKAIGIKGGLNNSSVVTATYTIAEAPPPPDHALGINTSWPYDWVQDRPFANIARTIRDVKNSDGSALLTGGDIDTNGYPKTTGFRLGLWGGQYSMNGTYAVKFSGQCSSVTPGAGQMSALTYDAGTKTTTATYVLSETGSTDVQWTFAGCSRQDGSGLNGIAGLWIMRPVEPGSVTSYAFTDKYTAEWKTLLQKFGVVRYMDWTVTNENPITTWSQRPKPTWLSYGSENKQLSGQNLGASWEEIVLLANEIQRDVWITVPLQADDDYVVKLAQLFAFGSDGSTPYTEVQGSPVYPPLDAGLKLYVEYSNEIWNTGFGQWATNVSLTNAVVATYQGGVGPLTYDGDSWGADLRRQALRTVEISNIFRAIFGDSDMIARVRPILAGQAYGSYNQAWMLNYLGQFIGEMTGNWHQSGGTYSSLKAWGNTFASPAPTTPTPGPMPEQAPKYFIYGGGGSGYWNPTDPNGEPGTLTTACPDANCIWTVNDMDPATWRSSNQLANAKLWAAWGLKRVAYEGGADFPGGNAATKRAAANLDRANPDTDDYNMRDNMLAHHAEWDAEGGDLFVYYQTTGDYRWGFAANTGLNGAQNIFDLNSPKLNAIDYLAQNSASATTLGTAIPGTQDGGACAYTNNGLACGGSGSLALSASGYNKWASYLFRASGSASRNVVITTTSPSGTVKVWLDGALAGSAAAATTTTISLGTVAAGLHGVIVQLSSGSATVVSVAVQ